MMVDVPCLIISLQIIVFAALGADLCKDFDDDTHLEDYVDIGATPKGGVSAGVYRTDKTAADLGTCLMSCCNQPDCNVVLHSDGICVLIACNSTLSCQPETRGDPKFDKTFMINVRSLEDTVAAVNQAGSGEQMVLSQECLPDAQQGCNEHEICDFQVTTEHVGYVCVCEEPYVYNSRWDACTDVHSCEVGVVESCPKNAECVTANSRSRHGVCQCNHGYNAQYNGAQNLTCVREDVDCEVGVADKCVEHEDCVAVNSRSRSGTCQCINGYARDVQTNTCTQSKDSDASSNEQTTLPATTTTAATTTTSPTTTTTTITTPTTQLLQEDNVNDDEDTDEAPSSTSTPPKTELATPQLETIVVSAGATKEIQLPQDEVTLEAFTASDTEGDFTYQWSLLSHPDADAYGSMDGINTPSLHLTGLVQGDYQFKVVVTAEGKYGEASVNVSVLPPVRENEAPVVVIKPTSQQIQAPNQLVIDGSESTDDDKIVKYLWELVSKPLGTETPEEDVLSKATLVLPGLAAGEYKFKLIVTDSDDVENYGFANVTVIKEVDYPPKANAGSNMVISLPINSLTLYGNASTDDKGIASYEWLKDSDELTADMTGVRTAVLELANLEEGDYTFTLKVTDISGQTDTADVRVFVKAEQNKPPVAKVGQDRIVLLPINSLILDGSNSTDDQGIQSYKWTQTSGTDSVVIDNEDRAVATASKLKKGEYKFKLVVTDTEGLQGEATLTVTVKENQNHPPKADAGGDKIAYLPAHFVSMDGSKSTDDNHIVSFLWTRNSNSLAAGLVLNGSDHQAVLQLSELVEGQYIFTLEVKDEGGLTSTDTASLIVKQNMYAEDLVEIKLKADIHKFHEKDKENLRNQISLLLHKQNEDGETTVSIESLEAATDSNSVLVTFYVSSVSKAEGEDDVVWSGTQVVKEIKSKLRTSPVFDFKVISIDTVVCMNNCSGHGQCSQATKRCVCDSFWMEDFFKANMGKMESNCDWSILYVIIVSFVIVITLTFGIAACVCLINRWYRTRPPKRHRYQLLKEDHGETLSMLPKGKMQNTSIMVSESDLSSDEETLFISKKPANGHLRNGLTKPKTKVRT